MMFIPWFEITTTNGDTMYLAALHVIGVNDDGANLREVVLAGRDKAIPTRLSADEIFERMGASIEGARDAEMEALYPTATLDATAAKGSWDEVAERDASRPVEPLPGWAEDWLPGGRQPVDPVGRDGSTDQGNPRPAGAFGNTPPG